MKYFRILNIFVMFLLYSLVVLAVEDYGEVYNPRPSLILNFTEETGIVIIDSGDFNLTNSTADIIDYFSDPVEGPEKIFTFDPKPEADRLKDGEQYFFTVRYRDNVFNYDVLLVTFTVVYPSLNITITEPRFGVTPVSSINLTIETDRNAICNYSFIGFGILYSFDSTGLREHRKEGLSIGGTTNLYIQCLDEYDKTHKEIKQLILDLTNPTISAYANDVTELPLETTLIVNANEAVICKFNDTTTVFEDMNEFYDYDEYTESSYKTNLQQLLGSQYLTDGGVNRFFVACVDKARRLSNSVQASFNVDTSQAASVTINYPIGALSNNILRFNVSTNKIADYCEYTNESDGSDYIVFSDEGKTHISVYLDILNDGSYTYYVRCRFHNSTAVWDVDTSTDFIIDSTPPYMLYVNMVSPLENYTDKTWRDDELCAEWEGQDDESSISLYAYYVYWDKATDELIEEGTTTDDDECVNVDLNDTEKYYFKVSAKNEVGLWSYNLSNSSITVDISLTPIGCLNNKKDGDETDIDCGGDCDGCANGQNCLEDTDCDNRYCNSSNKCAMPRCNDDVRNGRETDVDCGGNCDKCGVGKYCNRDNDCKTNNCDASTGKCTSLLPKCENNLLDVGETDIDCGGSCPGCDIGKSCDSDIDCISAAECKGGICILRPADSDGDGINDDDDNCPNVANEGQEDVEGDGIGDACDSDSDNDGLPDSFEQQYFDCVTCANPDDDPDKEGLLNLGEYSYNTNPTRRDTDGDRWTDKEEIDRGTDPLDPSSHPSGGFWKYILGVLGLAVLGTGGYFGYKVLKGKKKLFVPPKAPVAKIRAKKPLRRAPIMRPRLPITKQPLIKPIQPKVKKPQRKAVELGKPKVLKPLKKNGETSFPYLKQGLRKEEESIFKRLSKIAAEERRGQVKKRMESLKLTDEELKERVDRLKKKLKVR